MLSQLWLKKIKCIYKLCVYKCVHVTLVVVYHIPNISLDNQIQNKRSMISVVQDTKTRQMVELPHLDSVFVYCVQLHSLTVWPVCGSSLLSLCSQELLGHRQRPPHTAYTGTTPTANMFTNNTAYT